jgi:hypothetical protein
VNATVTVDEGCVHPVVASTIEPEFTARVMVVFTPSDNVSVPFVVVYARRLLSTRGVVNEKDRDVPAELAK